MGTRKGTIRVSIYLFGFLCVPDPPLLSLSELSSIYPCCPSLHFCDNTPSLLSIPFPPSLPPTDPPDAPDALLRAPTTNPPPTRRTFPVHHPANLVSLVLSLSGVHAAVRHIFISISIIICPSTPRRGCECVFLYFLLCPPSAHPDEKASSLFLFSQLLPLRPPRRRRPRYRLRDRRPTLAAPSPPPLPYGHLSVMDTRPPRSERSSRSTRQGP